VKDDDHDREHLNSDVVSGAAAVRCSGSSSSLWEQLRAVDPMCASWYHPNDVRRIQRCLDLWHDKKVLPSVLRLEVQPAEKLRYGPGRTALLWVDTDSMPWLDARLNARVDRMLERGLLSEVQEQLLQGSWAAGGLDENALRAAPGDRCQHPLRGVRGSGGGTIWSAIGFKELAPCCMAGTSGSSAGELRQALELMKANTRRYARQQRQWIRNRFLKRYAPLFADSAQGIHDGAAAVVLRVCMEQLTTTATGGDNRHGTAPPVTSLPTTEEGARTTARNLGATAAALSTALVAVTEASDRLPLHVKVVAFPMSSRAGPGGLRHKKGGEEGTFAEPTAGRQEEEEEEDCEKEEGDSQQAALAAPPRRLGVPPLSRRCELCDFVVTNAEELWQAHIESRRHRGAVKHHRLVEQQRQLGREIPPKKRQR
jgi:tRNA A37 N6-isopentenylltransferase MiaA